MIAVVPLNLKANQAGYITPAPAVARLDSLY